MPLLACLLVRDHTVRFPEGHADRIYVRSGEPLRDPLGFACVAFGLQQLG